jgi:hypothetical protein
MSMNSAFNARLNLTSNGQIIAARGPCNWDKNDASAEIGNVTIYQGSVRSRCRRTATRNGGSRSDRLAG